MRIFLISVYLNMEIPQRHSAQNEISSALSPRYLSLDVLRGMTIALMVVVNNPGSWSDIYGPFKHAAWHGFTPTDLVFPSFLFVVGNAMSFSMKKFDRLAESAFFLKVGKRALTIFLAGLLLTLYPLLRWSDDTLVFKDFSAIRIMGVLQRIAVCYFISSFFIRYLKPMWLIVFSILLLIAYWALLFFWGSETDLYSLSGNAALKFDLLLIRPENLYHGFGIPFDPEGLLSCLPACINVIAGFLAGAFIQGSRDKKQTALHLILIGGTMLAVGLLWDKWFPINKPLWTSSYVVYSVGWNLLVLAGLIYLIEVLNFKSWTRFFESFGKNPLFIFIMSAVVVKTMALIRIDGTGLQAWVYKNAFLSWLEGKNASLAFALSFMLLMWLLAYWMDRRRIYVKV